MSFPHVSRRRVLAAAPTLMPTMPRVWQPSSRFCQQLALALAHESFERLGFGAADGLDRICHRVVGIVRIDRRTPDGAPERGEMLDRVRIVVPRRRVAAPLLVGNLLIVHVLGQ